MKAEIYKEEGYRLMGAAFEVYNEDTLEWKRFILSEYISTTVQSAKISAD
jgi:hypothetical protein